MKLSKACRAIILFLLFACTSSATAADQGKESEFRGWLSVRATKRFDFDLNVSLEAQVRLFEYTQTFTEIGLNYKALDFLNIGGEVRFKFLKGGETEYRLAAYAGIEAGKKNFEIEYRFKVQNNFSRFESNQLVLRNKINAKYTIKKDWRLNTSIELFLPKQDDMFWLRAYRWSFGLRYKITKMHLVTLFYSLERIGDLDDDDPIEISNILGFRYDIRW